MSNYLPELIESRELVHLSLPQIYGMEERLRQSGPKRESGIILAIQDPRAYYVTQELETFDREMRRTAARARSGTLPLAEALSESVTALRTERVVPRLTDLDAQENLIRQRPRELRGSLHGVRPDAPSQSSLRLVASEAGSSLLLLEAIGAAVSIMASDPLTAIANAAAWSGPVRYIRAFLNRRSDPLAGVSARQALTVLSEFGGNPQQVLGPPDQTIEVGGPEIHLPNGMTIKGSRRINLFQQSADGATSWIEIE